MRAFFKGFISFDRMDDAPNHEQVEFIHPIEFDSTDLEGHMYDVACMVLDNNKRHDWITVVAYELDGTPIECIEFGRRFSRYTDNEFGLVWDPSRDYWHDEEIPDNLL